MNALRTLVGLMRAAGPCRDVEQVLRLFADRGDALDLDKRVGRSWVVDADHDARITGQRATFRGVLAGVECQLAAVDDKPNGCDKGPAVGSQVAELPRASAFG